MMIVPDSLLAHQLPPFRLPLVSMLRPSAPALPDDSNDNSDNDDNDDSDDG
jgi:hypothetical protein